MSDVPVNNKYHSDLARTFYAKATYDPTTNKINYGAPVRIKGAVSITLSKKGDLITFKSDGVEDVLGKDNQGYDGDLEALRFPESFEIDCLGNIKNNDGTVDEFEDDDISAFALLFEFKGDKKNIRHCLYWCHATNPNVEGDNPDSKTPKTEKITINARPRPTDGKIKTKTGDTTTQAVYDGWYTAVPDQTPTQTETQTQDSE